MFHYKILNIKIRKSSYNQDIDQFMYKPGHEYDFK